MVPLLGAEKLWESAPDRAALLGFLDGARSAQVARADVRARAAYELSLLDEHEGRAQAAADARLKLGIIERLWVVGPFDNEGRAGHAAVFPPEQALHAPLGDAAWAGRERTVRWRLLPPIAVSGVLELDSCLKPDSSVTAYVTVAVKVPRAEAASVRLGSSGAVKVWVNGQLVLDHNVYRPLRFDQDVAPARLRAGWNRLTIKLSAQESGGFALLARVSRPDGGALDGLELSTEPANLLAGSGPPEAGARPFVIDAGRELSELARKKPRDAQALTDWGLWLAEVSPEDPEQRLAERR
jgi:hypothetical protein